MTVALAVFAVATLIGFLALVAGVALVLLQDRWP